MHLEQGLLDAVHLAQWLYEQERSHQTIQRIGAHLADILRAGGRILACGNGGSMCDAMHFAEELSGRYRKDRQALSAQAISDPAHLTCVGNDYGFDRVFARGVEAWGRAGDVLTVFSTSGNSRNLVAAAETANARGISVVGILGRDGGMLKSLCDHHVIVPGITADRIQEVHIKIVHLMIETVERHLFPENYATNSAS
jgi:D-sedoheptulose 7-phosphate isomerase